MRIRLRHVRLTRSGKPAAHEEHVELDVLTIGRGTDNRLQIPGLSVPLHLAALYDRPDGVHIEPTEPCPLSINGRLVHRGHVLCTGDVIRVGQHEVRVLSPSPEERIALEIEQVEHERPETEELLKRTKIGIERGVFSRRTLSWAALGAVLVFGLVFPLIASRPEPAAGGGGTVAALPDYAWALGRLAWATGPVSRVHSFKATDCAACHALPFARVRDQECQACHKTTGSHIAPGKPEPAFLVQSRCVECHAEHRGDQRLITRTDATCTGCHADIKRQMSDTQLGNVSRFTADDRHPEFKILMPVGTGSSKCERVAIAPATLSGPTLAREEPLILRAGLRFPHALHLQEGLRTKWAERPTADKTSLGCPDCHAPDAGGALMRPIRFAEHCQSCHDLSFSEAYPDRQTPHPAQPPEVEADLFQFYAARALAGERTGAGSESIRKRPGAVLTEAERLDALARARLEADKAKDDLLGKRGIDAKSGNRGACAVCHMFTADASKVLPVRLAGAAGRCEPAGSTGIAVRRRNFRRAAGSRWLEFATFSHEAHQSTKCERCHMVETAATSPTGMLPGRAICVECHRRGVEGPELALDACVQCHRMHIERYGPMHGGRPDAMTAESVPSEEPVSDVTSQVVLAHRTERAPELRGIEAAQALRRRQ